MRGLQLLPLNSAGQTHPPHLGPDKRFSPKDNFRVLRNYDARGRQSYQNVSRETFLSDWPEKPDKPSRQQWPHGEPKKASNFFKVPQLLLYPLRILFHTRKSFLEPRLPSYLISALTVACTLFMENLDSTVIATSLPAIAKDLHEDPISLKLALTSYLVSLAIFIPASGWAAGRCGAYGSRLFGQEAQCGKIAKTLVTHSINNFAPQPIKLRGDPKNAGISTQCF